MKELAIFILAVLKSVYKRITSPKVITNVYEVNKCGKIIRLKNKKNKKKV